MDLERTSGYWQTSVQRRSWEECDKEYGSTLVGGTRDDEGIGGLSEEAWSWGVPQASQLGDSTESRGQQVGIGKSAKADLAELVAGLLWGGDENTFIRIASDGKSLRQNRGTADVHVESSGDRIRGIDFTWKIEIGQQKPRSLSDAGATRRER